MQQFILILENVIKCDFKPGSVDVDKEGTLQQGQLFDLPPVVFKIAQFLLAAECDNIACWVYPLCVNL
jgi:hypothetical protein